MLYIYISRVLCGHPLIPAGVFFLYINHTSSHNNDIFLQPEVGHDVCFHHREPLVPLWPQLDGPLEGNIQFYSQTEGLEDKELADTKIHHLFLHFLYRPLNLRFC